MTKFVHLILRQLVPALDLPLAGGGIFSLNDEKPPAFTLLVFYRRLHCPICKMQLRDMEAKLEAFAARGVNAVAISSDTQSRAEQTRRDWGLSYLRVAYELNLFAARSWGLYISRGCGKTSAGIEEPEQFSGPALYLVRLDGTLYFGSVQTMPFARPALSEVLNAIDFVTSKNFPRAAK